MTDSELARISDVYARRTRTYDPLDPAVYLARQERERALIRWVRSTELQPLRDKRLLDLGCGSGSGLMDFLRIGFVPENLFGNDLIEDRLSAAQKLLPSAVTLSCGDASAVSFEDASFDVVYQSMMCTSILDRAVLSRVISRMKALVRPGGGVLWYDFVYDNPANADVRGISTREVLEFFPSPRNRIWRLTLAPPLSRLLTKLHPALYTAFNAFPFLRSHVLCWLPRDDAWFGTSNASSNH